MSMQIAPTIRPVRMFLTAKRRVMLGAGVYSLTSMTIAQNSSAR